jgi:hypothetical protein
VSLGAGLQVHAGAKGVTDGGQDRAHQVVVFVQAAPCLVHAEQHFRAEGVLRFRAVEGDDEGFALFLDGAVVCADIQFFGHLLSTPGFSSSAIDQI